MWLSAPDHRPLLMAYFLGPSGWHNTQWKTAAHFGKADEPGWAEFTSEKARQRIWIDAEAGKVEVQDSKFSLQDANTFVVLHVTDRSAEKIVPLGVYDLRPSTETPASVLLLRNNPELAAKLKKLIG